MTRPTRLPDQDHSGYATGYTVIAGVMGLALLFTIPLAAEPLTRTLGFLGLAVTGN